MTDIHNPQQNKLLKALPIADYERILVHLELTEMSPGEILFHSGEKLQYVYFPTDCFMSLLYDTEDGATTEIASIGNDGVVGVGIFMTGSAMPFRALVQSTGYAYRMSQNLFMEEFSRQGSLYHKLLSYTQVLITQTAQMAVCNRFHKVDQQLCRFLLLSFDWLPTNELAITQELISNMLGVRREGITEAAGKLQQEGLIHCRRGHIAVLDREGLEARSCECYQVVKTEFERLLAA
ncbi:MAG: Crp/Fnr family transcriptional regulator [Nitrosomonas sp.]|nr:Crp/Fnr family transcriptional regulator [Nitrosomonas sp.]OQW83947.1 MAG: Crp/Fnr family transcriptional regulator [Proteobacteria bacterium ST_bin16]